jgi:hypothetical protein
LFYEESLCERIIQMLCKELEVVSNFEMT